MGNGPVWIGVAFLIVFLFVHLFKMMRLYLVLMEQNMDLGSFVLLYLRTTFVNLLIPFKLGELYRIFCIGRKTGIWQVGFLSVIIDRFFDMVGLFIVLLPLDLFLGRKISLITGIFLLAIILLILFYKIFMPTYQYLNEYIIVHKTSHRSMMSLRGLDVLANWFQFVKGLIRGRFALIIGTSLLGWLAEIAALKLLSMYLQMPFGISDFSEYIEEVFMLGSGQFARNYSMIAALLIGIMTIIGYVVFFMKQHDLFAKRVNN